MPILKSIMSSNNLHIDYVINRSKNMKGNRVGILGITFKGDADDMRQSPAIALMSRLLKLGYEVFFYDDINLQEEVI